jgi:signal transduction histidine kinase
LEELRELTRGALAEMRTLLMELRPDAMAEASLKDLLRHLTNAFIARARIPVQFSMEGSCELPLEVKIAFYRIIQEALNNIDKHSEARQVTVTLISEPLQTRLVVSDDGQGFDLDQSVQAGHFGLRIMRERAEQIGAEFQVDSQPGLGTHMTITWQPNRLSSHEEA